jgi:hypothetical protein
VYSFCTPWGENKKYDFILDSGLSLYRVQVKSVNSIEPSERGGAYCIRAVYGNDRKPYSKKDIDFVVCYVIQLNVFYIIPVEKMRGPALRLYPHRNNPAGFYEEYKEAWHLIT